MKGTKADLLHELEDRLRFETLLADISTRFINLSVDQIDGVIEDAQRSVCELFGLDLSSLWQWSSESQQFLTLTHLYCSWENRNELPRQINGAELFPWQYQKMMQGEILSFSTEDLPPEAARDKETRRHFGIKSTVSLPLAAGGGPIFGTLTFSTLKEERSWQPEIVKGLTLIGQIFSNALGRKQYDENLRASEARLAVAIDISALGFYEMGVDLRAIYRDDRIVEILGAAPEDESHLREFWLAHIHPEDLPRIKDLSRLVLVEGVDRFEGEYRYLHPKNGLTWLHHVSCVLERNGAGRAARVIGVMRDISEYKEKEESLKASRAALKNSQKDLRRLAGRLISTQEEELRRLSRELHDDLTQRLAVLAIEAGKLERHLETMEIPLEDQSLLKISRIKEQLISVSEDVHRISRQLHPTILDDLGLVRAIESECAALQLRGNIQILFRHANVPDRIPKDISLCLYRIVQEGLKNIIQHSGAERCEVELQGGGDTLRLKVIDEGRGFEPVEVRSKPGLGITSMLERVQLVRGDFEIDSRPGRGTVILVTIPPPKEDA